MTTLATAEDALLIRTQLRLRQWSHLGHGQMRASSRDPLAAGLTMRRADRLPDMPMGGCAS
ncbi:hypothetical protein [Rugosimonospora africana]|uniref:hypothetical protein n=1 Tax=Rugosimonospora africana TaxID=556532 RepID=UPI0019424B0B|nr:hypothetical protein [Rugosimonospora africana]